MYEYKYEKKGIQNVTIGEAIRDSKANIIYNRRKEERGEYNII